jgi:GPH family glycoside/pentoside/hexuronide:cation symporter
MSEQSVAVASATAEAAESREIPISVCVGWGIGSLGMNVFGFAKLLLMRFMTDILGITPGMAGLLMSGSKLYDAATDPIMGVITDRTSSRWGRRRPYLLLGSILCAMSFVFLFNVPVFDNPRMSAFVIGLALILYSTAYTIFNVPYIAMPAEMTRNYHERSFLITFRVYGIAFGQVIGGFLGPIIIAYYGGGAYGHGMMAWIIGAVIFVALFSCFVATKKAKFTVRQESSQRGWREQWRTAKTNRPFIVLLIAKLATLTGTSIMFVSLSYFVTLILETSYAWLGYFALSITIGMILSQPAWLKLSRRFGKRASLMGASIMFAMISLSWLASFSGEAAVISIGRSVLLGLASGGILLMGQSMLPDTIEYDSRRTGMRREGIFSGLYTTIEKLGSAFGAGLAGATLSFAGYIATTEGVAVVQPASAITGIYICLAVLPAITAIISAIAMFWYDLSEEKLKNTTLEIG